MRSLAVLLASVLWVCTARAEQIAGVVLDANGQPAAGASVSAAAIFHAPPLRLSTTTDAQGGFRLDLPPLTGSKRYALAVRWQRQGADLTEVSDGSGKEVAIAGQALPPVIVRLRPAGALHGKLLRTEDDGPIAGARLFIDTGEVLVTDERGGFELLGLPMAAHSLILAAPGRVRQYVLFDTTLEPEAELEIRLPRGAVLRGRLLDEQSQPIQGAYLTRSSSGTALTLNGWNELADDQGRYEYGGLAENRLFYSLTATAPGYESVEVTSEIDDPTLVIDRDIRLKKRDAKNELETRKSAELPTVPPRELPRRTLQGSVHDPDGNSLADADVRWGTYLWDATVKNAKTDRDGRYALAGVPGGKGAMLVLADGFAPQFVPVGEEDDLVNVRLSRGVTVRGTVKSSSGKPVAGVQVVPQTSCQETGYCNPIWLSDRETRTNDAGEFELTAIPEAGVTFDFLKDGYSDKRDVTLNSAEADNKIVLETGGGVCGRVVDEAGQPVRNFKIRVMIPRVRKDTEMVGGYYAGYDWYGVLFTRNNGEFLLTDVPAGAWMRLVVSSPDHGVAIVDRAPTAPLDALLGAENLLITLKPFQALNVKVTATATGEPLPRALVSLLEDEIQFENGFSWGYHDLWAERRHADRAGTAHFGQSACEDGTLFVRSPGFARKRVTWTDHSQNVTVSLDPAAVVRGEVKLGESLLSDGIVRLVSATNDFLSVDLKESGGKFEFPELPAGECALSVSGSVNQVLDTRRITVKPGEARELVIVVKPEKKTEKPPGIPVDKP